MRYLDFRPANSLRGLASSQLKGVWAGDNRWRAAVDLNGWWDFGRELVFRLREIVDPMERYTHHWTVWKESPLSREARRAARGHRALAPLDAAWQRTRDWKPLDRLLYLDLMTYLPDDLQVKIDIASMAVSLEVRAPFLDHRLVELAASMPSRLKFHKGQTKALLRQIAEPLMPAGITGRGKQGFSMPVGRWLCKELRPMMEALLLDGSFSRRAFFRPEVVHDMVKAHVSGQRDHGRHLWLLLNFELWYRTFIGQA
jgi:asparagine synthase (glutamine-hydrolysing)